MLEKDLNCVVAAMTAKKVQNVTPTRFRFMAFVSGSPRPLALLVEPLLSRCRVLNMVIATDCVGDWLMYYNRYVEVPYDDYYVGWVHFEGVWHSTDNIGIPHRAMAQRRPDFKK